MPHLSFVWFWCVAVYTNTSYSCHTSQLFLYSTLKSRHIKIWSNTVNGWYQIQEQSRMEWQLRTIKAGVIKAPTTALRRQQVTCLITRHGWCKPREIITPQKPLPEACRHDMCSFTRTTSLRLLIYIYPRFRLIVTLKIILRESWGREPERWGWEGEWEWDWNQF